MSAPALLHGIVGARPNMMKMAPLARALANGSPFRMRLIHTGQHYDEGMSDVFLRELGLPQPAVNLEVGSGPHGQQTARVLERYERLLLTEERPLGVIVVGDVNSTLACALAAVKLGLPVAHVEAGLRSFDRTMPEEINRVMTDAIADVLLVSEPAGAANLVREGRDSASISLVGNIMIDNLRHELPHAEQSEILEELGLQVRSYAYATLHRPANVDHEDVLRSLMRLLDDLSRELPIVLSAHPRTRHALERLALLPGEGGRLRLIPPQPYAHNLRLLRDAQLVLTDSGGIQEETAVLGVPCLTIRPNTERPITVELGTNEVVGTDPAAIADAWQRARYGKWKRGSEIPLWDGGTAPRIVGVLRKVWLDRA